MRMITFLFLSWLCGTVISRPPNVVFVLTDDQDIVLGSMQICNSTRNMIGAKGVTFTNAFVSTPICCPSRAAIQSGRYMHNNGVQTNACGEHAWQAGPEKLNLATYAHAAGYQTWYSGKYLNNYGFPNVGGVKHIPPGWTNWFGLVGNSKYYDYDVSDNGTKVHHGHDYAKDYFTDLLANKSIDFIKEYGKEKPFFVMIGTPAPHVPNIFAPQYSPYFRHLKAPRTPSWNHAPNPDKHWLLQVTQPMDHLHINYSDETFQDRWRALQSVNDLVERVIDTVKEIGEEDNTYFMYSSDHGQHLGQFGMGFDKRQLYETDIRIPFLVRGPGIPENVQVHDMISHVDIAPTILDMMGVDKPPQMDGRSWLPLVKNNSVTAPTWRKDLLVEYHTCGGSPKHVGMCGGEWGSTPCDAINNTYACVRSIDPAKRINDVYCVFDDDVNMVEYYDLNKDVWQVTNQASTANPSRLNELKKRLLEYKVCHGDACFNPPTVPSNVQVFRFKNTDDMCLTYFGHSPNGVDSAGAVPCTSGMECAWWLDGKQIRNVQSGHCLNLNDARCKAGTSISEYFCSENGGNEMGADNFKWTGTEIRPTECTNMCVAWTQQNGLALQHCGDAGTQWAGEPYKMWVHPQQ